MNNIIIAWNITSKPGITTDEKGFAEFSVTVNPGETKRIKLKYVEHRELANRSTIFVYRDEKANAYITSK